MGQRYTKSIWQMLGQRQVNWSGGQARTCVWQVRVRCCISCILNVTDHRRWDKQRDTIKVLQLRLPEMPRHSHSVLLWVLMEPETVQARPCSYIPSSLHADQRAA